MVAAYLEVPDVTSACGMLNDFSRQVVAVQGKKLENELADRLVGGARDIMTSIECN